MSNKKSPIYLQLQSSLKEAGLVSVRREAIWYGFPRDESWITVGATWSSRAGEGVVPVNVGVYDPVVARLGACLTSASEPGSGQAPMLCRSLAGLVGRDPPRYDWIRDAGGLPAFGDSVAADCQRAPSLLADARARGDALAALEGQRHVQFVDRESRLIHRLALSVILGSKSSLVAAVADVERLVSDYVARDPGKRANDHYASCYANAARRALDALDSGVPAGVQQLALRDRMAIIRAASVG